MNHIEHVVVLMMENHSFDNLLGMVPWEVPGRVGVDRLSRGPHGAITNVNRDASRRAVHAAPAGSPCQFGDRYFSSVLAQTYPNRRFLFCATASGITATDNVTFSVPARNGTIFDRLDQHAIPWGVYYQNAPSFLIVPGVDSTPARQAKVHRMHAFYDDAKAGRLPAFTFLDPQYTTTSEEDPQDIQVGERFIASVVNTIMHSPTWARTALFLTYDEGGGYYDHVAPPRAIAPDSTPPIPVPGNVGGGYDRYGFRVPMIVVSPWARRGYVSHIVQDHTSLLAFVERKWNLPAMTYRDANAAALTDYFDFRRPAFREPPALAFAPGLGPGLRECHAAGLNPPLPGGATP